MGSLKNLQIKLKQGDGWVASCNSSKNTKCVAWKFSPMMWQRNWNKWINWNESIEVRIFPWENLCDSRILIFLFFALTKEIIEIKFWLGENTCFYKNFCFHSKQLKLFRCRKKLKKHCEPKVSIYIHFLMEKYLREKEEKNKKEVIWKKKQHLV